MSRSASRHPLAQYNARRDFGITAEPEGTRQSSPSGNLFIVQKHAATRLHWDFRLEAEGVLKSWAVTRGPSLDPEDRRLAVRTEDHPLSYAQFEGVIPQGEYGGGTVMLWDRGTWEAAPGKSAADLADGHLHFILHGERMKGEWLLVRMKPRGGEKRENWLLRKIADDHAGGSGDLVDRALTSVLTGRSMAEIAADRSGRPPLEGKSDAGFPAETATPAATPASDRRKHPRPAAAKSPRHSAATGQTALPAFAAPQLATLVDAVPAGNGWMHEIKFDGYRALVAVAGNDVRIYTRTGLDWTDKFAPLARALAALDLPPALIDGEITAPDAHGNPGFSALQAELKRSHGEQGANTVLDFHAFDLLRLDGENLAPLPNIERKQRLAALLADAAPPIHVADHVIGAGEKLLQAMCDAGMEGIIAKRIDAPYRGTRTRNWVKVKCIRRQEFVIIGATASSARGRPFASLLLAQHEDGRLVYKGRVGTGFDEGDLDELDRHLDALARSEPAAEVPRAEARGARWVAPDLVAEIAFAEVTAQGRVRHASFLGLRTDKPATDVQPESPVPAPRDDSIVAISNRSRVIFPGSGETKGDLADYYAAIAPLMLPFLAGRPVSLVRCPQGRAKACFFQKHDSGAMGDHVRHVPVREKDGGTENYLYVEDATGVLQCVQMGTIEFHTWAARTADVEAPDRMVFDLDPDTGLDFDMVKSAAAHLRDRLADLGLASFAMLSGGKGIHIVVPLRTGHDWVAHAGFARRFAEALAIAEPDRFTATMSKAKRKGRIFIDWLRNQRGSTAIAPYSARARDGAPVAVPIAWDELSDMANAHPFGIRDAGRLLERGGSSALRGWGFATQTLPDI